MSSKQATLGYIGTETPDRPEWATTAAIGSVPNFDREPGDERTKLGAPLGELIDRARGRA